MFLVHRGAEGHPRWHAFGQACYPAAGMRASLTASVLVAIALSAGPAHPDPRRPPAFELRALGVLGGDLDTNLSCYLLGRPGEQPRLMLDGGSVVPGVLRWKEEAGELARDASWSERTRAVMRALEPVDAVLVTHAHLDHVGGFLQKNTLDTLLARAGRPPLQVVGLPVTIDALRQHALRPPLWVDFTTVPPENPALRLAPLEPGAERAFGPFRVRTIPVNHPDGGAAFLVHTGTDAYLHVGDTGRCPALWKEVRPVFRAGELRALSLEVSFRSAREPFAVQTGHLTPASFLLELADLAGVDAKTVDSAAAMTAAERTALAARLAPRFRACPVIVTHIKAAEYDSVVAELEPLVTAGLNLVIPRQAGLYAF
jgi:cAMP phosphodiesterase